MKNELPHLLKPLSEAGLASQKVAVVLPITDPSSRFRECLVALTAALGRAVENGHQADLFVVIDGRNADCAAIASTFPVHLVTADFSDLASARAIGARAALSAGATWLAFTESSALVADSWLVEQIFSDTELLLGNVEITNSFMAAESEQCQSGWHGRTDELQHRAANFSNLGMSRSAFELACNLAGSHMRLDVMVLDQLASLELATHRCSKPLVYARVQTLEEILFQADTQAVTSTSAGDTTVRSVNAITQVASFSQTPVSHCAALIAA